MSYFEQHQTTISRAIEALHQRTFYAHYPEFPSPKTYGETADADGRMKFQSTVGKQFNELLQDQPSSWVGLRDAVT